MLCSGVNKRVACAWLHLLLQVQKFYMGNKHAKEDLAPHVFRMADVAYSRITTTGRNQTFVISGESGAGKTVTTKYVIAQVMELCKAYKTDLESKIAKLNPFLEAFGNAKTVMNNNSSRFGKYTELKFDKLGNICGGKCQRINEWLVSVSAVLMFCLFPVVVVFSFSHSNVCVSTVSLFVPSRLPSLQTLQLQ